jgi:small redox-active disulfide protein 2
MMEIKVLGPGCARCRQTEQIIKDAVAGSGITATTEKVTDPVAIASFGVMATPAVVVDGVVKSAGKVPGKQEVAAWLR